MFEAFAPCTAAQGQSPHEQKHLLVLRRISSLVGNKDKHRNFVDKTEWRLLTDDFYAAGSIYMGPQPLILLDSIFTGLARTVTQCGAAWVTVILEDQLQPQPGCGTESTPTILGQSCLNILQIEWWCRKDKKRTSRKLARKTHRLQNTRELIVWIFCCKVMIPFSPKQIQAEGGAVESKWNLLAHLPVAIQQGVAAYLPETLINASFVWLFSETELHVLHLFHLSMRRMFIFTTSHPRMAKVKGLAWDRNRSPTRLPRRVECDIFRFTFRKTRRKTGTCLAKASQKSCHPWKAFYFCTYMFTCITVQLCLREVFWNVDSCSGRYIYILWYIAFSYTSCATCNL